MSVLADDHPEWTLRAGDLRACVSPLGASLRRMWMETPTGPRDLVWGYSGTANKRGGQGDVLAPFPGRIGKGAYSFEGKPQQLPCNDKDGPNAIHGFVRSRLWAGDHDAATARFRTKITATDFAGYPFALDLAVGYELLPTGLVCAFVARNVGPFNAPFGAGFHPYIAAARRIDDVELEVPASDFVEFENLLPTGRVIPVPPRFDFQTRRRVGDVQLNHCFSGLRRGTDGFARITVGAVQVWVGPSFPYLVLYTGDALGPDARRALAVEPMTCATDAFNRPALGLKILQPGETFAGAWGISPVG